VPDRPGARKAGCSTDEQRSRAGWIDARNGEVLLNRAPNRSEFQHSRGEKVLDIVLFTITGIALYGFSDWVVRRIESARGGAMKNRSLVFFAIITPLALLSFALIRRLLGSG